MILKTAGPIGTRQTLRPCVKANRYVNPLLVAIESDSVTTLAKPLFSLAQLPPPSKETKTPRSVPIKSLDVLIGSTTIECTGTSGILVCPAPSLAAQLAPPSVLFHTCAPPTVAYVA